MRPADSWGNTTTRVLLATISTPHPTVRAVGRAAGLSPMTAYHHLRKLRALGLVDWKDGPSGAGTLRPTCRIVAMGVDHG